MREEVNFKLEKIYFPFLSFCMFTLVLIIVGYILENNLASLELLLFTATLEVSYTSSSPVHNGYLGEVDWPSSLRRNGFKD